MAQAVVASSIPASVHEAAAAVVQLINGQPRSPRQDEIAAIISRVGGSASGPVPAPTLRDFFASGIETEGGGSASSTAIQDMIRKLVEAEDPRKPLSDARLADTPYLGGEEPCFADIIVGAPLFRYYTLDFDRARTPHLDGYYRRLTTRPAYAEHVMVSYEAMRAK